MSNYRVLFLSSSDISLALLEALEKSTDFELTGIICQPDKPVGRKKMIEKAAPKHHAERYDLPCYQPENLSNDSELLKKMSENPPDFLLTFSYGQILSEDWLALPKIAALNVHPSLLPKYRGATPIQSAILHGDNETGISLMEMVKKMDAGNIYAQMKLPISHPITSGLLFEEIAKHAAQWVPHQLLSLANGELKATEQDHSLATYTKKITKQDGFVDFKDSAHNIHNKFHAYTPWPGIWTTYNGLRLKLLDVVVSDEVFAPGSVSFKEGEMNIGTSDGSLKVKQLQLEGKQSLHADQFIIGQPEFSSTDLPS